ncbi:DUF998 domain-containing protein [Streptomyces sp. NPDC016459]|uniref:DUF998 domain-containing protein n=1 Tax=Streptomyces sp. NPDC016459 TaxID=3157190 RepID=UPI0033EDCE22
MPRTVTRAAATLLALGAVAYTAWVLEVVIGTGLDPVRTYVSELAAADQPLGGLFRATDLAAGLLVLAGGLLALAGTSAGVRAARTRQRAPKDPRPAPTRERTDAGPRAARTRRGAREDPRAARTPPRAQEGSRAARTPPRAPEGPRAARTPQLWALVGWGALVVFGAATAVDSRLPLSCAPTADPACAARETAGLVPATHTAHAVSSGLAMTGALVALVALTVAARRYGRLRPLARAGPVLVVLELAATVWTLAAVAAFEAGRGIWALGAGQRLQVLLIAVWLGVLAYSLATEEEK